MCLLRFSPVITLSVILAASLVSSSALYAGGSNKSGNPYGNGNSFPDSGNFSAIVRGTNGYLAVVQFATSVTNNSTNSLTNSGIATVYAQGEQFTGAAFGAPSGSTIAATYQATYNYNILVPTQTVTTNSTNTTFSPTAVTDISSGQFSANLYNTYPTQIFSGEGQATVIQSTLNPRTFILSSFSTGYATTVSGSRLVQ